MLHVLQSLKNARAYGRFCELELEMFCHLSAIVSVVCCAKLRGYNIYKQIFYSIAPWYKSCGEYCCMVNAWHFLGCMFVC